VDAIPERLQTDIQNHKGGLGDNLTVTNHQMSTAFWLYLHENGIIPVLFSWSMVPLGTFRKHGPTRLVQT